jgi:prepilin-type processing-associated H-X9-DG protein
VPFVSNSNLSFFIGVTASDTNPAMFLAGDDNLTNGVPVKNGILSLTPGRPTGWTRTRHNQQGNIALADGSVMSMSTPVLRAAVASSGTATNTVEIEMP